MYSQLASAQHNKTRGLANHKGIVVTGRPWLLLSAKQTCRNRHSYLNFSILKQLNMMLRNIQKARAATLSCKQILQLQNHWNNWFVTGDSHKGDHRWKICWSLSSVFRGGQQEQGTEEQLDGSCSWTQSPGALYCPIITLSFFRFLRAQQITTDDY